MTSESAPFYSNTPNPATRFHPESVHVILNPKSGRGDGRQNADRLKSLLAESASILGPPIETEVHVTTSASESTELARSLATDPKRIVAAAGGDGTLHQVVRGMVGGVSPLGIIPLGTGNDFVRTVGIPQDLKLAVQTLFNGVLQPLDIGTVNGLPFINVARSGFDAVVAERVNRGFRYLKGAAAYNAGILSTLFRFKPSNVKIIIDDQVWEGRAMLCSVANAQYYGGGMRIAPNAQIDDGLLDLVILKETGLLEFLLAFPRVFKGTHIDHPKITILQGRNIRVVTDPPQPIFVDGEVIGKTPAEYSIIPAALQVVTPDKTANPGQ
ncbi:MAG: diacylglycerol kinase family protein [Chthonomonadales bacterium]